MTRTPGDDGWLSVANAARLLRIRSRHLRGALRSGEVAGKKQLGRWYTTRKQILAGIRKRCLSALRQLQSADQILAIYRNPPPLVIEEPATDYPDEVEVVDLGEGHVPPELIALLDTKPARLYRVLPIRDDAERCTLMAADPRNTRITEALASMLGKPVRFVAAHREIAKNCELVAELLKTYYPRDEDSEEPPPPRAETVCVSVPADLGTALGELGGLLVGPVSDLATPMIKLLQLILVESVRRQATGIRWVVDSERCNVSYEIRGELQPVESPPLRLYPAMLYLVKLIASLKLNTSAPQAGELWLVEGPPSLGWRVTTTPGERAEDVTFELMFRDKEV